MVAVLALAVSILGIIIIPLLILMFRAAIRWKGIEDRLSVLVGNEDKIHAELIAQMREDRAATNRRLRWLEENLWKRNGDRT